MTRHHRDNALCRFPYTTLYILCLSRVVVILVDPSQAHITDYNCSSTHFEQSRCHQPWTSPIHSASYSSNQTAKVIVCFFATPIKITTSRNTVKSSTIITPLPISNNRRKATTSRHRRDVAIRMQRATTVPAPVVTDLRTYCSILRRKRRTSSKASYAASRMRCCPHCLPLSQSSATGSLN